jgi:reverse gyrase
MAVNEALSNAGSLDIDMVNAQQARRVLDLLVGCQVSPVLWKAIKGRRRSRCSSQTFYSLRMIASLPLRVNGRSMTSVAAEKVLSEPALNIRVAPSDALAIASSMFS